MKRFLILSCVLALGLASCQKKGSDESTNTGLISKEQIIGAWDVQWVTKPETNAAPDPSVNYTMNGLMTFSPEKLTINAYGYEGCIFGTDTLSHSLNWTISGDTLNLINKGDKFGIPYLIKEATDKKVKLQLVEDVFLFLTKK